ncbi:MAG TPA: serine hydrolase domain-containing protein [Polyangiales bacterium]|nr:serine hydrolase domain-containing protein [Polyangiales bacterium]
MVRSALDFSAFDAAVNQFIERHNSSGARPIAGASVVVVDAANLLHAQGYGRYAADRLYLIASASKILSAGVIMRLCDQRTLRLDEPLRTYVPDWPASGTGDVTLAQLLSSSSGLPSVMEVTATLENLRDPYAVHLYQFVPQGTLQETGLRIYKTEPPRKPNTHFAYGGSQWQLAGAIAEIASGKSWAQLVRETYVEPCGVPSLGYTNPFASARTYPPEFDGVVANLPSTDNPNIEGGAYITAPDYGKLLQLHLNHGLSGTERVLSEASVAIMQQDWIAKYGGKVVSPSPIQYGEGYGLGWWINTEHDYLVAPGTYGAFAWLDRKRRYAAISIIENGHVIGGTLALEVKPIMDALIDARG